MSEQPTHIYGEGIVLGVPNGRFANQLVHIDESGEVSTQPLGIAQTDQALAEQEVPVQQEVPPVQVEQPVQEQPAQPVQPVLQSNGG